MKCNIALFTLLTMTTYTYAASPGGFGDMAEQILPQIWLGHYMITWFFGFMSAVLFAYAYNLWCIHRKNSLIVPLHRVIFSLILALFSLWITFMDRPGNDVTIKPIPIVKSKKIEEGPSTSDYKKKHWSCKKSTQNND